jgi:hypothetical protein
LQAEVGRAEQFIDSFGWFGGGGEAEAQLGFGRQTALDNRG